ncbi:glycosyltransferase [Flavobacterium rhizosphaerae]|uniref:Glycosyltransferase n=1 Tax=Flavobacterium rhizosphaerae TaxID=3163298 RepID=A0ABW8YY64_9FLAO
MQKTAIIIPCYNEEKRLEKEKVLLLANTGADIYLCNDGSTDNTAGLLQTIAAECKNCFVLDFKKNTGKGNTVYQSVQHVLSQNQYTHIGYFDADFSTPVFEIERLLALQESEPEKFIIGSRVLLLNHNIKRKNFRHYIGRIIITLVNFKFKLTVYDTQCGAKLFPATIAAVAFNAPFKTSWLFDVELFIRLKKNNLLALGNEVPLRQWTDVGGSKLGMQSIFTVLAELVTIYRL